MAEGDFRPSSFRPKPLTRAQLLKRKKQFEDASNRIEEIKKQEEEHHKKTLKKTKEPDWV